MMTSGQKQHNNPCKQKQRGCNNPAVRRTNRPWPRAQKRYSFRIRFAMECHHAWNLVAKNGSANHVGRDMLMFRAMDVQPRGGVQATEFEDERVGTALSWPSSRRALVQVGGLLPFDRFIGATLDLIYRQQ